MVVTRLFVCQLSRPDTPFKDNKALPNYTNQAMNRDIKELCKLAGIHTGRRTFIVNALSLGIPPNVVMKWTGHNDYKAMKPYIDIVDSIKASEMTKLNGLI